MTVRPAEPADLPAVTRILTGSWGGTTVVALGRGELIDAARPPGIPIRHELELPLPGRD